MEINVTNDQSSSSQATRDHQVKYKGVRLRKWGKYVSEIRLPNSRQRIWLGSYDSAVEAARAFDAAQFCLRGPSAKFNFPDDPPDIPGGRSLTPGQIQVEAARFAHSAPNNNNNQAETQQPDAPSVVTNNEAGVERETSLLDEFRTMGWESESVSEFGYFQGFDDFRNELFLSGPNYVDDEVEETNGGSFLWNF